MNGPKVCLFILGTLLLLSEDVLARGRRRGSGNQRRGSSRGRGSSLFGDAEVFEAVNQVESDCDNPATTVAPGTTVAVTEGPETNRFISMRNIEVCNGETEGTTKCICYRSPWRRLFRQGFKFKCGTCQMSFVPDSSRNGFAGALIALDDEEIDEFDQDERGTRGRNRNRNRGSGRYRSQTSDRDEDEDEEEKVGFV